MIKKIDKIKKHLPLLKDIGATKITEGRGCGTCRFNSTSSLGISPVECALGIGFKGF